MKGFKYCLVPLCRSTTFQTPKKIFINLPINVKRRNKWLRACHRNISDISPNSVLFICEDHFNLEEDMENYVRFKLMGGQKKIKEGVVPHIFDCQPERKKTPPPRVPALKRVKRTLPQDAVTCSTTPEQIQNESNLFPNKTIAGSKFENKKTKKEIEMQTFKKYFPKRKTKNVQCKSIGLLPFKQVRERPVSFLPFKRMTERPILPRPELRHSNSCTDSDSGSCKAEKTSEEYCSTGESDSLSSNWELEKEKFEEFKDLALRSTIMKIEKRPRIYLGLPEFAFFILELLQKHCKIPNTHIYLTLKKIQTGHSFTLLADDFGMSEDNASKIFAKSLSNICKYLRKCIIKPNIETVKVNLPVPFLTRYSNVYCIINCLEIEIEKPSDAVKNFLTWSEYKKCNSLKYLISCTPDGIINFISTGFSGRTSDAMIVEHSGFLSIIPHNIAIMANRGFKHIEHLLVAKNCKLIRPPNASSDIKSMNNKLLKTKRNTSLRIYVERVIHRLQEFAFLTPFACIDHKLIPLTDHIIKIACGLINLQSGVISGN